MWNPLVKIFGDKYVIKGVAADEDTLLRTNDQIFSRAFEDIHKQGYFPSSNQPEVRVTTRRDGNVSFSYTWRVEKFYEVPAST